MTAIFGKLNAVLKIESIFKQNRLFILQIKPWGSIYDYISSTVKLEKQTKKQPEEQFTSLLHRFQYPYTPRGVDMNGNIWCTCMQCHPQFDLKFETFSHQSLCNFIQSWTLLFFSNKEPETTPSGRKAKIGALLCHLLSFYFVKKKFEHHQHAVYT